MCRGTHWFGTKKVLCRAIEFALAAIVEFDTALSRSILLRRM
jgi:hypothetical protein